MLGGAAVALMTALLVHGAMAQGEIEQVVVSASRITIAGYTSPTPVTVVGAAQLKQDAYGRGFAGDHGQRHKAHARGAALRLHQHENAAGRGCGGVLHRAARRAEPRLMRLRRPVGPR